MSKVGMVVKGPNDEIEIFTITTKEFEIVKGLINNNRELWLSAAMEVFGNKEVAEKALKLVELSIESFKHKEVRR